MQSSQRLSDATASETPSDPCLTSCRRERVAELRKLCIRIYLNDFGRDWAPVAALNLAHADFVRLDTALVHKLGSVRSIADTVLALVREAQTSDASVIAREVDNIQPAHLLLRLGVDCAVGAAYPQTPIRPGFGFSRPL